MKVVILGGYDRYGGYLRDYAEKRNIEIKFIDRPRPNMEDILKKADCVIVLTRLVSHEMLRCAKTLVPEKCIYCKKAGLCTLKKLVENFLINNRN
jgi:hypothetical protein